MKSLFAITNNDSEYIDVDVFISDDIGPEWCIRVYKERDTNKLVTIFAYAENAIEAFDNEATTVPVHIAGELVRLMPEILETISNAEKENVAS